MTVLLTVSLALTEVSQTVALDILRTVASLQGKFTEFSVVTQRENQM